MTTRKFISHLLGPLKASRILSKELKSILREYEAGCHAPPVLYDVGARWGISKPYDILQKVPGFVSVGFEPDEAEATRLENQGLFTKAIPVGLGDKRETRTLYMVKDPGCSSLFPPDCREISRHMDTNVFEAVGEIGVSLVTMKQAQADFDLPQPDFLKVDCEGAEEIIFKGAGDLLEHVTGVSFEARLVSFYQGEATLQKLLNLFVGLGFVALDITPVGYFCGEKVMFDVIMIRHPESYTTSRQFLLGRLFSVIFRNSEFARRIKGFRPKS